MSIAAIGPDIRPLAGVDPSLTRPVTVRLAPAGAPYAELGELQIDHERYHVEDLNRPARHLVRIRRALSDRMCHPLRGPSRVDEILRVLLADRPEFLVSGAHQRLFKLTYGCRRLLSNRAAALSDRFSLVTFEGGFVRMVATVRAHLGPDGAASDLDLVSYERGCWYLTPA